MEAYPRRVCLSHWTGKRLVWTTAGHPTSRHCHLSSALRKLPTPGMLTCKAVHELSCQHLASALILISNGRYKHATAPHRLVHGIWYQLIMVQCQSKIMMQIRGVTAARMDTSQLLPSDARMASLLSAECMFGLAMAILTSNVCSIASVLMPKQNPARNQLGQR